MSEVKPVSQKLPDYGTLTDEITIFAGPCSVESEEQFNEVAECIASLGLHWIRGGAFKPRTNPHSFQGLGEEALQIMKAGGDKYGLRALRDGPLLRRRPAGGSAQLPEFQPAEEHR